MAEYFFGNAAGAINKIIRFDDNEDLKVTAVLMMFLLLHHCNLIS
jgi:hypothetical protein